MTHRMGTVEEIAQHYSDVPEPDIQSIQEKYAERYPGTYQTWVDWLNDPHTRYWFDSVKAEIETAMNLFNQEGRAADRAVGRFQGLQELYYAVPAIVSALKKVEDIKDV